jgi:hypothetical protein
MHTAGERTIGEVGGLFTITRSAIYLTSPAAAPAMP